MTYFYIFYIFDGLFFLYILQGLVRNELLSRYRLNMINKIFSEHENYKSNIDIFSAVTYDEMFFKFWRSFDSFYPKGFLKDN